MYSIVPCQIITGALTRLYEPDLRSPAHPFIHDCFHCALKILFMIFTCKLDQILQDQIKQSLILGDSLSFYNSQAFATKDKDDTEHGREKIPCSTFSQGAWWYQSCFMSNLNGVYLQGKQADLMHHGVTWKFWRGVLYSLKTTEMKIRRK